MRNLKADLELCNKATMGPWKNFSDTFEPTVYTKELDGCRGSCIARMFGLYTEHTKANAEFVAQAREGWPYAIERALEAEKRVEELENQIDILSTTLNMYCSPYYDMWERAEKAEALARELVEAMNGLLYEYEDLILRLPCSTPVRGQPIHYNSQAAKQAENLLIKAKEVLGE